MLIPVGVSNRHVHLSEEVCKELFGNNYHLKLRRNLKQIGEYSSETVVTLKTNKNKIENVRVIGPLRDYTQVEILKTDAKNLGLNPPTRASGDLENSESITIVGLKKEITLKNSCIIAQRHIHMNVKDAQKFNVENDEIVKVKKDKQIIDNVHIKIKENYILEFHIDKDEAMKFNLQNEDLVEMIKE